ncbi:MAG: transglutaminase family protein [Sporichthyaceae bacterium]
MAIRVAVEHRTLYTFEGPTDIGPHLVRLRPAPGCRTPITGYSLRVEPADHFINWQQDVHGNHAARLVFPTPARELRISVDLIADLAVINPFDFFVDQDARDFGFSYPPGLAEDLHPYLVRVREPGALAGAGPLLQAWLADFDAGQHKGTPIVDFLVALNREVAGSIAYSVRMETGVQSPDTTLGNGLGSCRDSAWLLVAALRELGLAARFVSGYLIQLVPDDPVKAGAPAALSRDFTDLHAWAEVFVPGAGWIGLDATSGLLAGEGHIPLVGAPRPEQAAPITGTTGPSQVRFSYTNIVRRIHEDPRVTLPYSTDQLARIHLLGAAVDERLRDGDVRLTMGGEPTFVAREDMSSAQWRVDADGPQKRELALTLAQRLKARYAPGGVLLHGQGKWYPGEPLPRWQIAVLWRCDGAALWADASLLDDPWSAPPQQGGCAGSAAALTALTAAIGSRLGVPADCVRALYEDPIDVLAAEARLPEGAPPQTELAGAVWPAAAARRHSLIAALDADRGDPAAWAIPLSRAEDGSGWTTTRWSSRRGEIYLRPGTSPAGLRLPLDSLAWTPPPDTYDRSRYASVPTLPDATSENLPAGGAPTTVLPVEGAPTTALCVQERAGHLCVFLPPLPAAEDTVALLRIVEAAAAETGTPVVLEGYPPAGDDRLRTLTVTPDPGVIEVNIHPSASWEEFASITTTLDGDARAVGLATETFALDGTHTGTGGGAHLTLGGPTVADSPLLRRPDLLVSMLTYWQHHPGLSYLFAGRFIGPTSQAPRVDEGRHETLYELEIAFAELARRNAAAEARPWHLDRALRHLLTDITGNTHRSEFCIDKLYSPDSERGRLGLLELRGFEMPPHPDMALVQALLVRALVARFWASPYTGTLVRWGTALHDSFLLPEFALADVGEVARDLREHGLDFDPAWLEPFAEFRFPRLGSVDVAGVHLELRAAVEPWHVLGEEVTSNGTARYVDSSLERVQVKVIGAVPGRHVITCNGVPIPLHRGLDSSTQVAGVRFKAWAPYSALHASIAVHSPLVFDVVDTWNSRALGGATYHVTHPGGRAYERFPVNAGEAEARRGARFVAGGHTPGPVDRSAWDASFMQPARSPHQMSAAGGEYPRTLDLRRFRPGAAPAAT